MKLIQKTIILAFSILHASVVFARDLPSIDVGFKGASVKTHGNVLTVSTGKVERSWEWTGGGLVTIAIQGTAGNYLLNQISADADWDLGNLGSAELVSLSADVGDDEGFTSEYLAVEAEIKYGELMAKYVIWAYPGAPGLRTQLWLKQVDEAGVVSTIYPGILERIDLKGSEISAKAFGYAGGLKNNVPAEQYNILESVALREGDRWEKGSVLLIENGQSGIILVKESNNHTLVEEKDKERIHNGSFERNGSLFTVDGLGLSSEDIKEDYRFCWANWMILYTGTEPDAQLALKQFDRLRFPVNMERDVYIMANTWGTEDDQDQCFYKAREANVLREIESCADLGIDLLQIDEGWQVSRDKWYPAKKGPMEFLYGSSRFNSTNSTLHDGTPLPKEYDVYPDGFGNVRSAAERSGIKLGLWFANWASLEEIKENYNEGNFKAFKLDFANLHSKDLLDELYYKARNLIEYTDSTAAVNWDVTEPAIRMGYYFGRECGNLYLANRKAFTARLPVLYIPWRQLRDAWELSKYMNLNKIQISINNKDIVPEDAKALTDAHLSTHGYNLAITLMSSPIFFTETQYFTEEARSELRSIIEKYKEERDEMYEGYVFPIGSRPDNESWSGFQNYNPETESGYLTIFRELHNAERTGRFNLHFLKPNSPLSVTNILTGETQTVVLGAKSEIDFEIPESPGFLFLKYSSI